MCRELRTDDSRSLTLPVLRLVRLLDRLKAGSVPVRACDAIDELLVFRAHARHCGFEQLGIPNHARPVLARIDGVHECFLQMAREVSLDLLRQGVTVCSLKGGAESLQVHGRASEDDG